MHNKELQIYKNEYDNYVAKGGYPELFLMTKTESRPDMGIVYHTDVYYGNGDFWMTFQFTDYRIITK